jgi:hypothetical protein
MRERARRLPAKASAGTLEQGLAELAAAERRAARRRAGITARAVQEERLRRLEQDLIELRGRVNGLIFLFVGAAITQVIIRLFG